MANKHQGAKPIYTPKGSMCMTCAHKARDCSRLSFERMPVIERLPGRVVVRCVGFVRDALKT